MFNEKEIEIILKGLDYSKGKNDEISMMLGGLGDPEVDEIYQVIDSVKGKISNKDFNFTYRELSEIKTGLMGLLTTDINNQEISSVLGVIHEAIYEMEENN